MKEAVQKIEDRNSSVISLYQRTNKHDDVSVDIYTDYASEKHLVFRDYTYGKNSYEEVLELVLKHVGTGITINLYPGDTVVYHGDGRVNLEGLAALRARDQKRATTSLIFKTRDQIKKIEENISDLEAALTLIGTIGGSRRGGLTLRTWGDGDDVVTHVDEEDVLKYTTSESKLVIHPEHGVSLRVTPPEDDEKKLYEAYGSQIEGFSSFTDVYDRLNGVKGVGVSIGRYGHLYGLPFWPSPTVLAELILLRLNEMRAHVAGLEIRLKCLCETELAIRKFACSFWMSSDLIGSMDKR